MKKETELRLASLLVKYIRDYDVATFSFKDIEELGSVKGLRHLLASLEIFGYLKKDIIKGTAYWTPQNISELLRNLNNGALERSITLTSSPGYDPMHRAIYEPPPEAPRRTGSLDFLNIRSKLL